MQQILESIEVEEMASLGKNLLDSSEEISLEGTVFMVQYLMQQCAGVLPTNTLEELQALLIGAKVGILIWYAVYVIVTMVCKS